MQRTTAQHTRGRRRQSAVALVGLLGAEVGAVGLLLALRTGVPVPADLLRSDVEPALHGAVWLLAAFLLGWLVATTVVAVLARVLRLRTALPIVDWLTLPPIRRLAERATAISLVASSMTGPSAALASEPPPIPVVVVAETPATTVGTSPTSTANHAAVPILGRAAQATVWLAPTPAMSAGSVSGFPADFAAAVPPIDLASEPAADLHRHVVAPGESMWTITARHLAEQLGAPPTNRQISEVWRVVMDLNRDSIRSGDVDLIFPGEELVLPSVRG